MLRGITQDKGGGGEVSLHQADLAANLRYSEGKCIGTFSLPERDTDAYKNRNFMEGAAAMKPISATDTLSLSLPERIQLVEDIWDTIANQCDSVELTDAEKRLIDDRLEAYHRDPEAGSPWEEVSLRIRGRME